MSGWFAGVDPGLSGAVAVVNFDAQRIDVTDIPVWEVGGKRMIDHGALYGWLFDKPAVDLGVVEHIHAMPKQGVTSSFNFGSAFGACCMAVAACGIPHQFIRPIEWKRKLRVPTEKDGARMMASRLLPWAAPQWRFKKDHNKAEAALLAYYARELHAGRI